MNEPIWTSKQATLALHDEQLAEHGGSSGIRDETLLDLALAKPRNVFAYAPDSNLFRLAASYAFGIARNYAFIDGNKRTALVVSFLFLNRNGWDIEVAEEEIYATFLSLAEGLLSEEELIAWFARNSVALEGFK